jgi:predicted nucleic acid-binding protein
VATTGTRPTLVDANVLIDVVTDDPTWRERSEEQLALAMRTGSIPSCTRNSLPRIPRSRRSPLPDFFIGAHAEIDGLVLLTRDERRYRTYFPAVELIAP